jgi:hypothetical protein
LQQKNFGKQVKGVILKYSHSSNIVAHFSIQNLAEKNFLLNGFESKMKTFLFRNKILMVLPVAVA